MRTNQNLRVLRGVMAVGLFAAVGCTTTREIKVAPGETLVTPEAGKDCRPLKGLRMVFDDVEATMLVQTMADMTCTPFVVSPGIHARLSFGGGDRVAALGADQAFAELVAELAKVGVSVTRDGDHYRMTRVAP